MIVWFAWHSLALTFIVIFQMWYYDGIQQNPTPPAWIIAGILAIVSFTGLLAAFFTNIFNYLDWLYLLSGVKVVITILKFLPQVLLNIKRRSTKGWNIHGCWMDLIGAILSILQFFLDCWDMNDWKGITGNLVKLCLGVVSGTYDIIFITQHYIIYSKSRVVFDGGPNTLITKEISGKQTTKKEIQLGKYSKVDQEEKELMTDDNIFCDDEMDEFSDIIVSATVAADLMIPEDNLELAI